MMKHGSMYVGSVYKSIETRQLSRHGPLNVVIVRLWKLVNFICTRKKAIVTLNHHLEQPCYTMTKFYSNAGVRTMVIMAEDQMQHSVALIEPRLASDCVIMVDIN